MITSLDFPRLTEQNHRVTSPATTEYNCIAWSARDTEHWWQPGVYWPDPMQFPGEYGIAVLEHLFLFLGYEEALDGRFEPGFDKVALYGNNTFYTHASRQTSDGKWTSKLGRGEDIEHDSADDVAGGLYGEVVQFMRRKRVLE